MTDRHVDPDWLRLKDIWQAIEDIEAIGSDFKNSRRDLLAVAYSIAVIGEACAKISDALKARYPTVPWRDIVGMRNKLIHEYGKMDVAIVAFVVDDDIPILKTQIQQIMKAFQ